MFEFHEFRVYFQANEWEWNQKKADCIFIHSEREEKNIAENCFASWKIYLHTYFTYML